MELLQRSPLLAGLSPEDLDRLVSMSETVSLPAAEVLITEGEAGDSAFVILEGELEVSKRSEGRDVVLSVRRPGEVIGEMALLNQAPRMATVRALQECTLLRIPADAFERLLLDHPSATLSILQTVTSRLRATEALLHQREKMAALGTLAAGLAHELNNPAAAAQRSTSQLQASLSEWLKLTFEVVRTTKNPAASEALEKMLEAMQRPASLDALMRIEREQVLQEWLESHGVKDAWQVSAPLASYGWSPQQLQNLSDSSILPDFPLLVRWLAAGCLVYSLLDEVRQSSVRLSQIVKAVKTYTYLDQAPIQEVDVHEGLESTLIMLRHKLKSGINVLRQYSVGLPRIEAYASELNQVWTNIIDNAIDAMGGNGDLTLRTSARDGHVVVEVQDSGPGIPPAIQGRIFEPFFTTKPPGSGSGLGLNIAYDIIVNKHHGEIHLSSRPGQTCFQVILPVRLERGKS